MSINSFNTDRLFRCALVLLPVMAGVMADKQGVIFCQK